MPRTPEETIENADLQWLDSGAPYSTRFDDIYFSRDGGLDETEHVFLNGNMLTSRWASLDRALQAEPKQVSNHFTIAELGFGTGLNFLCCWRAWQQQAPRHLRLHYIACEKFPLQLASLRQALQEWPELAQLSEALCRVYPDHSAGYHRLHLPSTADTASITLDLYYGDAADMLAVQAQRTGAKVDAWFLDGFAPRVNPQMWRDEVLAQIARLSTPGTTLSTYSVAGSVVRGLQAVGFELKKRPGFGKKRQMLVGEYSQQMTPSRSNPNGKPSWLDWKETQNHAPQVIVIGAGLAGCATAYSLARKGIRVLVLEQQSAIASGASGNRQAVLQCRLNNSLSGSRQFNLQAFLYATQQFTQLSQHHANIQWQDCGVFNLDTSFSARKERCPDVDLSHYSPQIAQRVEQSLTSELAGLEVDSGSNYIPLGGWLVPAQLCQAYLEHPLIQLRCNTQVLRLERVEDAWQIYSDNALVASAAVVVIANSYSAAQLKQTALLPIVPIRGQVSYLQASAHSEAIAGVICGKSYISPVFEGLHSVGASYSRKVTDLALSDREHLQNIEGIAPHLQSGNVSGKAIVGGRVSIRATTGDRMPIVGPVPDFAALETYYSTLGQRDRKHPSAHMPYLEGLYVSVGHGSHGLSNAPICAETIASAIANELLPLQRKVLECIHPGRFFLRELRRRDYSH